MPERKPIPVGSVFVRLTVVETAISVKKLHSRGFRHLVKTRCICGNESLISEIDLRSGNTKSCGCIRIEQTIKRNLERFTHRMSLTPTYHCWQHMKQRCLDPSCLSYKWYGARGINICERWLTFENFFADMGEKPKYLSLDRINNDGNYEPSNCRWATWNQQHANKRNNKFVIVNGQKVNVMKAIELVKISDCSFYKRRRSHKETNQQAIDYYIQKLKC